jgi:hypothetical protein
MTRSMLDQAGMHVGWWYFAIRHTVPITNLVLLEAVEEGSLSVAKRGAEEEVRSMWSLRGPKLTRHIPRVRL